MDERDEQQSGQVEGESSTERVRIVGAEPASMLAGEPPAEELPPGEPEEREQHYLGFVHQPAPPPPGPVPPPPPAPDAADLAAVHPELPHWSDPPTGQVPAVIDRRPNDSEDAAWAAFADSGPVWREHQHEWEDTGGFEPSMLADDETRVGALDESTAGEHRPWEFRDLSTGPAASDEPESPTAEVDLPAPSTDPSGGTGEPGSSPPPTSSGGSWWEEDAGWRDRWAHASGSETELAEPTRLAPVAPTAISSSTVVSSVAGAASLSQALPQPTPPPARGARRRPPSAAGTVPDPPDGPENGRRSVPVAVATGIVVAAVLLGCFAAGPLATMILIAVMVTVAAAEAYASFRRTGARPATLLGLAATAGVIIAAYYKGIAALPLVTVVVMITAMLWYLVGAERGSPVRGISATMAVFVWVGVLGSFGALLVAPSIFPHRHGVAFALGAVVATVGADVGALAVGSWLGRHQLSPHVSPNKTWEGWAGGAVLAIVLSVFITGHVHPWTPGKAAILGVVVAIVAPVGDLCESLVKRDLGLKDMGSLLPGHGGVIDRMDALLFVLPATYYLVRVLNLG